MSFGEQVIAVLEKQTRRWQYWSAIWDQAAYMSEADVKKKFAYSKWRIEIEYHRALSDFLIG